MAATIEDVVKRGNTLVTETTHYLSALPHQIPVLEELIAIAAVTSSLLTSLSASLTRFSFPASTPFIAPLCLDIARAFCELEMKVSDARILKVWEKNELGLVRNARCAWVGVCGGEREAGRLRSRLYVEKYRVRVLVDAVTWEGLRRKDPCGEEEKKEVADLRAMLPLLAERLVGVQRDYVPRLKGESPVEKVPEKGEEKKQEAAVEKAWDLDLKKSSNLSIHSLSSTTTFASTPPSPHHETWLLRRTEAKRTLSTHLHLLTIPLYTSHNHVPASHYTKPLPSSHSEIVSYLASAPPLPTIHKSVLKLPDDAQWEIQKLCESREKACSSEDLKRGFEVVAFEERPRRKIAERGWWKGGRNGKVEWVLVLRGETVDRQRRVAPAKHEDPWNVKPKERPVVRSSVPAVQHVLCPFHAHVQGNVVKRVPERKQMSVEEAEVKMGEILGALMG